MNAIEEMKKMLTMDEAVELTKTCRKTLLRACEAGRLKINKSMGHRSHRINVDDLYSYMMGDK